MVSKFLALVHPVKKAGQVALKCGLGLLEAFEKLSRRLRSVASNQCPLAINDNLANGDMTPSFGDLLIQCHFEATLASSEGAKCRSG